MGDNGYNHNMNNVDSFLRQLEEALDLDERRLNADTSLEDLDWDSLAVISCIVVYSRVFGTSLDMTRLEKCKTIGDILSLN